jgi:ubiquinone/menaquinone biosynthesis C-methylase UbiE
MGTGALAYHLDDQVETIYGMDLSRAMMEKAPKEISKIQGNLLNIPIFDSSIPCVVLRNVIHYIEDKQSAVREVFRILEPEGTLIFSQVVPFDEEISPEYDWLIGRQLHYPTVSELKHLLQSFRIETEKEVVISAQSILNWLNHTTQTETEKLETLERHRQTSNHYKQLVNYYEKDNDIFVDIKHICLKLRKPG